MRDLIDLESPLPDHVTLPEIELSMRLRGLNVFPVKSRASVPVKGARKPAAKRVTKKKKNVKRKTVKKKTARGKKNTKKKARS